MKIVSGVLCLLGSAAWAQEAALPFVPPFAAAWLSAGSGSGQTARKPRCI